MNEVFPLDRVAEGYERMMSGAARCGWPSTTPTPRISRPRLARAVAAFGSGSAAAWKILRAQGVFVEHGPAPKVAFLYPGQGSQYVNMLQTLRDRVPVVAETFAEADRIMTPLLGRPLTSYVFVDGDDPSAVEEAQQQLTRTEITQPAMLATDLALTRLLDSYGVRPDMVMGHSLGEYAALVTAGAMSFEAALEAVSARGREMASLSLEDPGVMAAVFGPLEEIERVVASVDGNVVVANINSTSQAVIGGATKAVERALEVLSAEGVSTVRLPVSHAFHTSIVAPASAPLKDALRRLDVHAPVLPVVSNVTGDFYPAAADTETILDLLGRQVASPVQFVRGLHTLYDAGARVFVEVGPKKALHGCVEDVLAERDDVLALFTNHPKNGDTASFNAAMCGLWAAGLGSDTSVGASSGVDATTAPETHPATAGTPSADTPPATSSVTAALPSQPRSGDEYAELGHLVADFLERDPRVSGLASSRPDQTPVPEPVVITGAALGLPGVPQVFDDENLQRILDGQQFIDAIPHHFRQQMVDLHITRLVKRESGDPTFETIDDEAEVVKLAGRHAPLDIVEQFGVDAARDAALDAVTRLAIGAGFDAMHDAGLPLVMRYKTTTVGSRLPERWGLPDALRDDTGVIFASAFPGYDSFAEDLGRYYTDRGRREQLLALEAVRSRMRGDEPAAAEVDRRLAELRHLLEVEPFTFDRRFLFRCLSMGHSQFAEIIGARGPNTQINAACASTTQALSVAEDWIRAGRCRRVVVVSADDVTTDNLLPWVTAGFLASGAAATDDSVEDAATPFDRRRHGMIVGMGAAAFVVETAEAARERGLQPDLRGARVGDGQQRLPRHPPRRRAHRPGDGGGRRPGGGPRRRPARDRRVDRLRLARDLHPGARRERRGRDQRPAVHVRAGRRIDRHHQHEGLHRARHGCRDRGRGGHQGPRDRDRAAGAQLQGARSRARRAQPLAGRRLPGPPRTPARRRVRLPDRHVAAALDPARGRSSPLAERARVRLPDHRPRRVAALAGLARRGARCAARGRHPPAPHRRRGPAAGRGSRRAADPRRRCRGAPTRHPRRHPRRRRPHPQPCPNPSPNPSPRRPGASTGSGAGWCRGRRSVGGGGDRGGGLDRRGDDRLPARPARPRPGPGGRPGRGHRQAGRGVRRGPRALRRRARRDAVPARLPDPDPRHRLGPRQDRRPGHPEPPPATPGHRQPATGTVRAGSGGGRLSSRRSVGGGGDRGGGLDRRGDDRLPARPARPRPGPGGRPRRGHRQAGRGVRRGPRALRRRARRVAVAARLPDPDPRHRLGPRQDRRPGHPDAARGLAPAHPGRAGVDDGTVRAGSGGGRLSSRRSVGARR